MKAKNLSKRIIAVVLTMMLVVGCFVIPSAFVGAAAEATTVNIHYLRDDKAYGDWDVWAWADGLEGNGYAFTDSGDANGAVATITITEATPKLGFIIRKPDWSAKDPEPDRYVDLSSVVSGTVEVYCKTGEEEFRTDYSGAKSGLKIKTAEAISHTEIEFSLTMAPTDDDTITNDDFSIVSAGGQEVVINAVRLNVDNGVIELADTESLDYSKEYTITFRDSSMKLTLPDYFSSEEFESAYTYDGDDLGVTFAGGNTNFRVWAPTAEKLELNLYTTGEAKEGETAQVIEMTSDVKGTWVTSVSSNLAGKYYTYTAYFDGKVNKDIVDPYARTVGVNGQRGMILDLDTTDPAGWDSDQRHTYEKASDMSIYEVHVRDFSSDPDAQFANPGKYVAFTETGVKTQKGAKAGIDYLKDLGVTSVHILPSYDYGSVDETKLDQPQYNFGYDPVNYNSPEGSYSTDPYNGEVRVNEYKQMVKALHDNGIGVIMDVVYNHTYNTNYCFNRLVPGYFYRAGQNTSGCGNDVASERSMVRKFIVDSVKYWADEYHLDGFRFDLMGILDVDTMNGVRAAVDTLDKNIFIYGEGWDMGSKPTKDVLMANYHNASKTPGIAYFSDYMRDTIRGNVFEDTEQGYVGGAAGAHKVKKAVKATADWGLAPTQIINYDSCHDNHTIWDRLQNTNPDDSEADRIQMNKMAAALVFTSQGVPFMMSGEEFLRTKVKADGTLDHNSYASPDSVNSLKYDRATEYADVYNYYKGLIALRKAFPQFRQTTKTQVDGKVKIMEDVENPAVGYTLKGDNDIIVFFNPARTETELKLPEGDWSVLVNGEKAGTAEIEKAVDAVVVPALTSLVLVKDYKGVPVEPTPEDPEQTIKTVFKDVLVGVSAIYDGKLENSILKVAEVDPKDVTVTNKDVVKAYTFELTVNGAPFALNDKPLVVSITNSTKDLKIVAVDKDGKVTDIASTYKDGAYEFSITDLTAKYALVKDKSNSQNSTQNQTPANNTAAGTPAVTAVGAATTDTVKTGDSSSATAVVLIAIASSAALLAIVVFKRKKRV